MSVATALLSTTVSSTAKFVVRPCLCTILAVRLSAQSAFQHPSGGCRFRGCRTRRAALVKRQSGCRKLSELPALQRSKFMTHVIVARWRPREGQIEKIEEILRELVKEIRREPGNLQFIVNRSRDDPNEFLLYEQYVSEQAF